jgi:hypothetical protein
MATAAAAADASWFRFTRTLSVIKNITSIPVMNTGALTQDQFIMDNFFPVFFM